MFDVEVRARVPEKGEASKTFLVMQYAEMVLFVRHDAALGGLQPLFVLRETGGVERHGGLKGWVVKGAQALDTQHGRSPPCGLDGSWRDQTNANPCHPCEEFPKPSM